jgi:tagatose 1,6-diphosphate aldolase GatY/KbaY
MMLLGFEALLSEHARTRTAIGAFTCYDLEVARAVLAAAAGRDVGVVLLISRDAFAGEGGDQLFAGVRAAAERSPARACVQLDHVSDLELIAAAFELGAGAVMADGSRSPFDENVALVQEAKRRADGFGAAVEAELGHVAGGEDVAAATEAGGLTDPAEAERFIAATDVSCLAVSIGNVHGDYVGQPRLDWGRLAEIESRVSVPLSLHGASGLADADLTRAVGSGVRKVNANTELRDAYLSATREGLDQALDGLRVLDLHLAQTEAVRGLVDRKIAAFTREAG